jgi:superfamily II DNA or RNA helicase
VVSAHGMSLEIALSPAGRLSVERVSPDDDETGREDRWAERLEKAFAASTAEGLLLTDTEASVASSKLLSPSLGYWRNFARSYLERLCQASGGEEAGAAPPLEAHAAELAGPVLQAPPMRGGEFLTADLLAAIWRGLGERITRDTAAIGLAAWLKRHHPHWHTVGRVTFHLAENKRDEQRPFAFLATYTHRVSAQGKPQHLPLARALREYQANQVALNALLAPVERAVERSGLARELFESRRIFQPLAWTPAEAHRFLKEAPALEESGLLVRLPDWWKRGQPARPRVQVKVGQQPGGGLLGLSSMMDFSVELSLDGETLTQGEWEEITRAKAGLALLRGKWVEIDPERLKEVLEHWRKVEASRGEGVSFLEGMRLLAGAAGNGGDAANEDAAQAQSVTRDWAQVVAGSWLRDTLAAMRDPAALAGFDPERGLQARLRPYQSDGVRWLHFLTRLGLGACLADDMGLGKTIQTIALLLQLKREKNTLPGRVKQTAAASPPSLLVAPASLLANWKAEIARLAGQDLVVTTYAILSRLPWLLERDWSLVILDEAQAIKNPAARQTRAVKALRARGRIALTGTPVENRLGDLWSLFDFINPGLLGSATEFGRWVKKLTGDNQRHFAPLRELTGPYILRRLKSDKKIIADLPDKTEVTAWCSLTKTQATLYEQSVRELAKRLDDGELAGIQRRGLVLAFLMRFKQICNHPSQWLGDGAFDPSESGKFARLRELSEEIAARQERVLVFTQFRELTAPLADCLGGVFGRPGLVLHGSTPVRERQRLVECFQGEDGPPFFVLSLKAGGTGLNLTAASHVIHFDRWWNPAVENQATDRAFRIGQKRNVLVHKFACRGTVEEKINALIEEKKALATELLGGGENGDAGAALLTEMADAELLQFVALDFKSALAD